MSDEKSPAPPSWLQLSDGPPEPVMAAEKPSDKQLSRLQRLSHAPPTWLQLESIVPSRDVREITSLSDETLDRKYGHLWRKLSDRRKGMKLRDVLAIANGE